MANATQRTQAIEDLKKQRRESSIENLLFTFPHLIKPGLSVPKRQQWISEHERVDLMFSDQTGVLVAEIKFNICDVASVRQLLRYLDILRMTNSNVRGVLIGKKLSGAAKRLLRSYDDQMSFMALDVDIPTEVLICAECRLAFGANLSSCPYCECTTVITI